MSGICAQEVRFLVFLVEPEKFRIDLAALDRCCSQDAHAKHNKKCQAEQRECRIENIDDNSELLFFSAAIYTCPIKQKKPFIRLAVDLGQRQPDYIDRISEGVL